jgi:hypothetical protein
MYIYPTDLKLNNTSKLLIEIPQNRYIKCNYIITHKIVFVPHKTHTIYKPK